MNYYKLTQRGISLFEGTDYEEVSKKEYKENRVKENFK